MQLTTREAATRLGITPGRVIQLIHKGILPAQRFGPVWQIDEAALAALAGRKAGWQPGRKRGMV